MSYLRLSTPIIKYVKYDQHRIRRIQNMNMRNQNTTRKKQNTLIFGADQASPEKKGTLGREKPDPYREIRLTTNVKFVYLVKV